MTNSLPAFAHGLFMLGMGALTAFLPALNTQALSLLGSPVGLTPPSLDTPGAALLGLVVMGYGVSQIHAASSNPKASAGILCSSGTVAAAAAAAGFLQVRMGEETLICVELRQGTVVDERGCRSWGWGRLQSADARLLGCTNRGWGGRLQSVVAAAQSREAFLHASNALSPHPLPCLASQNQPFFYVAAVIAAIFAAWGFQDNAASKAKKSSKKA